MTNQPRPIYSSQSYDFGEKLYSSSRNFRVPWNIPWSEATYTSKVLYMSMQDEVESSIGIGKQGLCSIGDPPCP